MPIKQLGKDYPAILATDDKATIEQKVRDQLARFRDDLDGHIAKEKENGEADGPSFCPNGRLSIPCCYVDEASAGNIGANATRGLVYAINSLADHGLFLIDVEEWRKVDFTNGEGEPPFPHHEIGLRYVLKLGAAEYQANFQAAEAERFVEAKRRFDAGELDSGSTAGSAGGNSHIAELLRQLGH